MSGVMYGNVVEWNVSHSYRDMSGKSGKYVELHRIFDKLSVHTDDSSLGWVRVSFEKVEDARRAQTAISQYCQRKHKGVSWRHQTSVSEEDGKSFLYLRKVPRQ